MNFSAAIRRRLLPHGHRHSGAGLGLIAVLVCLFVGCSAGNAGDEPAVSNAGGAPSAQTSDAARRVTSVSAPAAVEAAGAGALWPSAASPQDVAAAAMRGGATGVDGLQPRSLAWIRDELVRAARDAEAVDALLYTLPTLSGTNLDTARYLLARALVALDRAGEALPHVEALPERFDPVDDRRLALLFNARRAAGDVDGALEAAETLFERHGGAEAVYPVRIEAARLLAARGDVADAERLLEANRRAGLKVRRDIRAENLRARVDIALADGREREARYLARELLTSHPAERATLREGLPATVDDLSARDQFDRADRLQRDMAYVEAREAFRPLMDHGTYGYEATWRVAEISGRWFRDDYDGALEIYEQLERRGGKYKPKLRFRRALMHIKEKRYDEALAIIGELPRSGIGLYYRGWIPYQRDDCETALPLLDAYARAENDSTVQGFHAWCFIREKRWDEAVVAFQGLIKYGNPIVRGKALYWQAYALHQQGRVEAAREKLDSLHRQYPLTWYDVLAYQMEARWDGRDARASVVLAPLFEEAGRGLAFEQPGDAAWQWPNLSESYRARLDAVRRLVELDELEMARADYARIRDAVERATPADQRWAWIGFIGERTGNHYHGWEKASGTVRAMSGDMPDGDDARWTVAYPRAYRPLVESLAAEFELPSALVYGIMLQESRFRWYQVSSWDALGALQMIPKTAVRVADDLGIEYDPHTFKEPRVGFRFSVYYMASHLAMWKNLSLTAASYNGGPHKVEHWMRRDEGLPMDMLVEEFGFDQSRHYCRKVTEHMLRYLYLYEADAERRAELLDLMFPLAVDYGIPEDTGY